MSRKGRAIKEENDHLHRKNFIGKM